MLPRRTVSGRQPNLLFIIVDYLNGLTLHVIQQRADAATSVLGHFNKTFITVPHAYTGGMTSEPLRACLDSRIDLFPSVCDLFGLPAPEGIVGASL